MMPCRMMRPSHLRPVSEKKNHRWVRDAATVTSTDAAVPGAGFDPLWGGAPMSDWKATISPPSAPTKSVTPCTAARTKLLLEGPILPTLLRLAAPNVLNLLAFAGVITFDGFFLGRIGTNALAGASLAFPFVMLVLQTTNSGMGAGVTSAIARALGAGKRARADELVFHALLLALALAVLFSTLML